MTSFIASQFNNKKEIRGHSWVAARVGWQIKVQDMIKNRENHIYPFRFIYQSSNDGQYFKLRSMGNVGKFDFEIFGFHSLLEQIAGELCHKNNKVIISPVNTCEGSSNQLWTCFEARLNLKNRQQCFEFNGSSCRNTRCFITEDSNLLNVQSMSSKANHFYLQQRPL